jgi:hypothetical protein
MGKDIRQTFEKMVGFSFVTPITGLNRPNTGKEDDDDEKNHFFPVRIWNMPYSPYLY